MQTLLAQILFLDFIIGFTVINLFAVDGDCAVFGKFEKIDTAKERCFARAGRADNRQDLALFKVKINALENFGFSETLFNSFNL